MGIVDINVYFNKKSSKEQMYVVPSNHSPLLGRVWIRHLQIDLNKIDKGIPDNEYGKHLAVHFISQIMQKYSEIFEKKLAVFQVLSVV